jgi:chromosome segregation ATPase
MPNTEELRYIRELLKEVRDDQKRHGTELAKQSVYLEQMDMDVKELKTTVSINTKDIAHHIKRTDDLQDLYQSYVTKIDQSHERLNKLEEPVKAKAWVKAHLVSIISVLTAIASIVALVLEHTNK